MSSSSQIDYDFFRILLYRRNGKELLLMHASDSFALPAVPIARHSRIAQRITETIRKDWKLDSCCLFPVGDRNSSAYAVELSGEGTTPPANMCWLRVDSLAERDFSEAQDFHAIDTATKDFDQHRKAANSPFGKLGWIRDIIGWVESEATPLGVHLTGEFQQFNASPTFSLIRFETDGPALWFKAVGDPNLKEYRITRALVNLFPDFLPRLIASHEIWNAWVTIEAEGHILAEFISVAGWQKAAFTLASLQIGSFGNAPHLIGAGCTDVRASLLRENIDSFFGSMTEVMTQQRKQDPPPLNRTELTALAKRIREALEELMESEIPNVLGHLDCNPGNIVVSQDKCVFLDWAEGAIGHPFFTIQYLFEYSRKIHAARTIDQDKILSAYVPPWQDFVDMRQITADLALAPLLAVYAYAISVERHRNRRNVQPEMAAFLRSLTRRMKREADTLQKRMSIVISSPPPSPIEPVVDDLHGVPVTDPYRWLEDQNSPRTRAWIEEQTRYARAYLDAIPGRGKIRERVRELLDVETRDSFLTAGNRYFFRKRLPGQEQAAIYFREVADGKDQLLIDPATRGSGDYTAVRPLRASLDGSLLLYEVKQGGERTGTFEILDVARRSRLADTLPHGYLRGFAFAPDGKSFYYVHEDADAGRIFCRPAFHHVLGTEFQADREIFRADEHPNLRLVLIAGAATLGFLVYRFLDKPYTDFYIQGMGSLNGPVQVLRNAEYGFSPRLVPGRIFALIDANAPNRRIVEVQPRRNDNPLYFDLIPEADVAVHDWAMTLNYILACYVRGTRTQIVVFDRFGKRVTEIPCDAGDTARIAASSLNSDEVLLERESFIRPIETVRCSIPSCTVFPLAQRLVPFDGALYGHAEVSFPSKDGTSIPLFLVGRPGDLDYGSHPLVMTAYGGFRVPSTPQFSVLVGFLMEKGCVFALPCIRGGSEFGEQWHQAAKRQKRQVAFDDFLAAAEWLIRNGRTTAEQLAIFGGSNSGLLVGAALSQRPSLFRAVICIAPLLDMLRYHLFDNGHIWTDEFGNADNRADFPSLLAYSPYHAVRNGTAYPATLTVAGDGDQVCNALHARKMVARLQHASSSGLPVLLDYSSQRGHSPALPLATRINALTDRLAFLSCALELPG